jgi:membrane-bound lytic murein transglycosylase D
LALPLALALALLAVCAGSAGAQTVSADGGEAEGASPLAVAESARPGAAVAPTPDRPVRASAPREAQTGSSCLPGPLPALHGRAQTPAFSLELPDNPAVQRRLETYLGREKRNLEAALARMARYRRFVDTCLRDRGLPPELLALPLLESRYLPRAVSRSGAAGLWQIMHNTSGGLGLRSDEWLDERRDFWKSTEAALRKLEEDRRQFGDWYLALAAYNCGSGCLSRLIASSGVRDFWELRARGLLRPETAEFVPAFIALARIVGSPSRFGLCSGWDPSPSWERVRLAQSVDLRLLARALDLDPELLREANAELRYPVTPVYPQGYLLKLPAGLGPQVNALLADPGSRLLEYRYHPLASGDTLYGLSRRYGVALALLEQANAGLDPRRLPLGAVVRIPVVDRAAATAAAPSPPAASRSAPDFRGTWRVAPGDTLWAIARRHETTPELLAAANGRSLDDLLKPGDTLKVPALERAEEP